MKSRQWWVWPILAGLVLAPGCDEGATAPQDQGVPEQMLQFLTLPPDLQPLVTHDTSFWAVRGQETDFVMNYALQAGETEAEEFMTFRIPADGLFRRPNGELFADGDSVQIRVMVDDSGRFLFDFEPSGLEFNPDAPAELKVEYRRLGGDLDHDGDVDTEDDTIEANLQLWKQEAPGDLWYPIGTIRQEELDELQGVIDGFTGFAVAV